MIRINLTGKKFCRLTAVKLIEEHGKRVHYECVCDCGNTTKSSAGNLRSGRALSCGCLRADRTREARRKHGMTGTVIYRVWRNMIERCGRPSNTHYASYGGRGISVCERWQEFANFFSDMGDCPAGMLIDRKDNDGNYCKDNCRWVTKTESANNKRNTVMVQFEGERLPVSEVAKRLGIKHKTLKYRLRRWPLLDAISRPVRPCGR